ncbi:MAG TPA: hypothetical protein VF659_18350 [Pyrinomonadaceae bacterium]|jgi:hypothetical protein
MQGKRALVLALVLAPISAIFVTAGARLGSTRPDSPARQERGDVADTPVVDFDAPETADPKERALRRARSKAYDYAGGGADAKMFAIKETSEPIVLDLPVSDGPKEPSLPVRQADAVVIGKITDARAYLSNDRTSVYSEFTTLLEDVLLDGQSASLFAGATIPTQRYGGVVRFPSGKTVVRGALGRTMPRVGARYLLFLRKDEAGQAFSIITGYALINGKVMPLDGVSKKLPQLAQFAAHENADEAAFIEQVRAAIAGEGRHNR